MKAIRPPRTFRYWTSRLALAAMLALVVMPTAGRLYTGAKAGVGVGTAVADNAGSGDGPNGGHVTHASHAGHAGHVDTTARDRPVPPAPDHAGHGDCPYCPLLAQLAGTTHPQPLIGTAPAGPAPSLTDAPGHAARPPHGLHARGPPAAA